MQNKTSMELHIFGKGGHGKVIASVFDDNNIIVRSFLDDNPGDVNNVNGISVVKSSELHLSQNVKLIIGIGSNSVRKKIAQKYATNIANYIKHPSSQIYKSVVIGKGTVVFANAVINTDAKIGEHCIINTSAVIEHDCVLEDFVHVSPNASMAGNVKVGEGTHIGIGASIIHSVKIGKWVTVGAGAVIIKDIPDGATVVGVPGRIIKKGNI
jgi:acetyltransferase EpsM